MCHSGFGCLVTCAIRRVTGRVTGDGIGNQAPGIRRQAVGFRHRRATSGFPLPPEVTAAAYFSQRRNHLADLPYGPFGDAGNAAILQGRTDGIDDLALAELTDPMPPMLPLLIAVHPSFSAARLLPRAKEILPEGALTIHPDAP